MEEQPAEPEVQQPEAVESKPEKKKKEKKLKKKESTEAAEEAEAEEVDENGGTYWARTVLEISRSSCPQLSFFSSLPPPQYLSVFAIQASALCVDPVRVSFLCPTLSGLVLLFFSFDPSEILFPTVRHP